jgi:hypothetical protein
MAASPDHGKLDNSSQGIHCVHQYSFPDAASRTGAPASMLVGGASKIGLQEDNFSLWLLQNASPTPSWVQIGGSSLVSSGLNLGTGASIFTEVAGANMQFKTLLAGDGINLSADASMITIEASSALASGINLGAGASIYHETAASKMQFKSLLPGSGINLSANASTITIETSAAEYIPAANFTAMNGASFGYDGATYYGGWDLNGGSDQYIATTFQMKRTGSSPSVDVFWQGPSSAGSVALQVTLEKIGIFNSSPSQSVATTNLYPFPSDISWKQKSTLDNMAISFSANDLMTIQVTRPSAASGDSTEHTIKILGVSVR